VTCSVPDFKDFLGRQHGDAHPATNSGSAYTVEEPCKRAPEHEARKVNSMKATEQPTFPFLFAARGFAADTQSEKLVLYHLVSRLRDGTCFPKQDAIAYAEQLTTRAIKYGIAALKKKGVVTIEKQGRNNVYRLHLKAIEDHQRPPMPETPDYVEPPTAKNILIGGRQVGKGNPSSPIEDSEQGNHGSPISGIGEISDVNRGTQSTCKKTVEEDIKPKKTVSITRVPDEDRFSGSQERAPQAAPAPQSGALTSDAKGSPATNASRRTPSKPRVTLESAQKLVEAFEHAIDLDGFVICADCTSVGMIEDGHCTWKDGDGTVCDSTRLVGRLEFLNRIRAQWDEYNKQIRESLGLPLKEIIGRLDVPSMERQQEIIECRRKAEEMPVEKRRHWAKQLYDSGSRYRVRKAWYLYASGMLDDDAGEPGPWVTQFFAELEALQPRDGGTK
jgi:hypothetical protein